MAARLKIDQANAPAYEKPAFFASERERYEYLFDVSVVERLTLTDDDAAFMRAFEQSPAYASSARRFEELRAMLARQHANSEAIA